MSLTLRYTVKNLGIIREAEIDVRPLTIFIGPNNTNKTWVAYTLYGLFRPKTIAALTRDYLSREKPLTEEEELLLDISERLLEGEYCEVSVNELVAILPHILRELSKIFSKNLISDFFQTSESLFENTYVSLSISEELSESTRGVLASLNEEQIRRNFLIPIEIYKISGDETISLKVISPREDLSTHGRNFFKRLILHALINLTLSGLFNNRIVLPAERKALIVIEEQLNELISESYIPNEDMKDDRIFLKRWWEPIYYQAPIIDFLKAIRFMRNLPTNSEHYSYLAKLLSQQLLRGELQERGKKLWLLVNDNYLPIHVTSTSVRVLTPLILYLSKLPSLRDLLIIDEPEMNLHPYSQLRLLEVLTAFVNGKEGTQGNFLILTTHTPYLLEHLYNLMYAHRLVEDGISNEKVTSKLILGDLHGFKQYIDPEKVEIILFREDGTLQSVLNRDTLEIDWSSFTDISAKLIDILDELEELKE